MIHNYTKEFKVATIELLLKIVQNKESDKQQQYYKLFQKELNILPNEFEDIFMMLSVDEIDSDKGIVIVMKELKNSRHAIMHFLMMLNRCIILEGCDMESYKRFEQIRDVFLAKL